MYKRQYIPYADCHPDASAGFTAQTRSHHLNMVCGDALWAKVPADQQAALQGVLENDPRPSYQHDPEPVSYTHLDVYKRQVQIYVL